MEPDRPLSFPFSGFVDYTRFFPVAEVPWIVLGAGLMIGTIISVIPQINLIIKKKSSYGLNPITIFVTNFNQCIILINLVCLHPMDFMGLTQIVPWYKSLSRMLTFGNAIALWLFYLPIVFLCHVFFDTAFRDKRTRASINHEKLFSEVLGILMPVVSFALMGVFVVSVVFYGPLSPFALAFGKTLGTLATVIVFIQYLPQMVTTLRLRDSGALSILMLSIQTPGGLANSLFLWIGQGDNWTTWISYFVAALEQFILLTMCIIFKCMKKRNKYMGSLGTLTHRAETEVDEPILNAPLVKQMFDEE